VGVHAAAEETATFSQGEWPIICWRSSKSICTRAAYHGIHTTTTEQVTKRRFRHMRELDAPSRLTRVIADV